MANTVHHPDTDTLAAFSAGSLAMGQALCVSTHLEHCHLCRQNIERLNRLGTALFDEQPRASVSTHLRESVMSKITGRPASTGDSSARPPAPSTATDTMRWVPKCLRALVPSDYDSLKWRRLSPSISCTELCRDIDGSKVELLRIRPGGSSGTHTHLNEELTVILEGSFSDEHGIYREGDYVCMDSRHKHTPVATRDKACICLVVTKAPVQFTGFFSRLLNPLLRRSYA